MGKMIGSLQNIIVDLDRNDSLARIMDIIIDMGGNNSLSSEYHFSWGIE